jgi:hypothetical protein
MGEMRRFPDDRGELTKVHPSGEMLRPVRSLGCLYRAIARLLPLGATKKTRRNDKSQGPPPGSSKTPLQLLLLACGGLLVEPHVFHPRTVVDAVDHDGQAFHLGIPAGCRPVVVNHRSGAVLLQFPVDIPH